MKSKILVSAIAHLVSACEVLALDSYRAVAGKTTLISEFGVDFCVQNNRTEDVLVPTRTSAEWNAFRSNLPSNVVSATCCPTNYVLVPALTGYTSTAFCVAKYEMKNVSSVATSQAASAPWASINRTSAISACTSIGTGYDLISNDQWQTLARNIADVGWNWSSGTAYSGNVSQGHSDNNPASLLAAGADTSPCVNTGQACTTTTWNSQRRTHQLSNGQTIWDVAGNANEWIKDNNSVSQGADGWAASFTGGDNRQVKFGNDSVCAAPGTSPYCGFGFGETNGTAGTIQRGGGTGDLTAGGIFYSYLKDPATFTNGYLGFRCVYVP